MTTRARGQSETVGVVLLTAVVVVLVSVVGVVLLADFDSSGETGPTVSIESAIDGSTILVEHQGGTAYAAADVLVVIRGSYDARYRLTDDNFDLTAGSDPTTFAQGDRWEGSDSGLDTATGEVTLRIFDEGSDGLLYEKTYTLE